MAKLCTSCRGAAAMAAVVCSISLLGVLATLPSTAGAAAKHNRGAKRAVANGPLVRTSDGPVKGFIKSDANTFLGIPYAAPPVGRLRWRPPQRPDPWRKTLKATAYGPTCPQVTTLGVFAGPTSVNEDCLYVNVFAPRRPQGARPAKLPVFVWIHGGGNVDGESNDYDGSKLANGGRYGGSDTVVVTINYRLGLLGFLANPALDREGHAFGNYGTMDIQAALRWVRRNIAGFGGDASDVTLGGQSAGASETGANVISPRSKGLFERAIFESSPTSTFPPLSLAVSRGTGFAQAAGCSGDGARAAACLRHLTVQQILQLQGTANANGPYVNGPMVDGTIIPITPQQAWTTGNYNHMPMLGGNVKDEQNFTLGISEYFSGPPMQPITADQYQTAVRTTYGGNAGPGGAPPAYPAGTADKVLAEYPVSNYATPQLADDAAFTDPGACRALHVDNLLSTTVPVYAYEFDYQHAPYYFPSMPGYQPLAAHTIDIQFLFPLWHGGQLGVSHPLNADETRLSDQLVAAWTNFASKGNPNPTGSSRWPRFAGSNGSMLSENVPSSSTMSASQFAAMHHCDFWNQILVYEPSS
jgi:para-nitrobenzyl esterase